LLRNADYITSKSNYLTGALNRLGGISGKIDRIVWGIPIAKFRRGDSTPLHSALGVAPHQRLILSPRILQPLYQIHLIVEAMPRVLAQHPAVVLLITEYAVDPEYRALIVNRVRELGIEESVRFCGTVPHDKMPEYYWAADIAVSVPRSDGMPQTLIEAMACETPNVLSNLPHYREMVAHEESAYFVEANPVSIADGISRLLDDRDLRTRIVQKALAIVQEQGDLDEQAGRVERRYQELVRSGRPRIFHLRHFLATMRALRKVMATS
jgi:glycosyltransferase involved in cell wall biosynthesis